MARLDYGKLPHSLLEELLRDTGGAARADVVLGPAVGTDAAVIRLADGCHLVAAADPITFATDRIGWYAVHVNANDVAVCGAEPRWFLATVLLPRCDETLPRAILAAISAAAAELDVAVVGGHTEVTVGLERPIVAGTMVGIAERLISAGGARPGHWLYACGAIAVEGTAILARELSDRLAEGISEDVLARAQELLDDPGISVVRPALLAARAGASALHDVTEGGILTAVWEMAAASRCGVEVELDHIPVLKETQLICQALQCDPYRLLGSGTLLIAVDPQHRHSLEAAFDEADIALTRIGCFRTEGCFLRRPAGLEPLEPTAQDELARILG